MQLPDIEKIRRFSLLSGLLLITYSTAIVRPANALSFSVFNASFNIVNPKYIYVGFILASAYGMARFILYGLFIMRSPWKERNNLLMNKYDAGYYEIQVKGKFDIDDTIKNIEYAFPSLSKASGGIKIQEHIGMTSGGTSVSYSVLFSPSVKTKFLNILHDVDYAAPAWVNAIALTQALYLIIAA